MTRRGWHRESARHSLAARGYKTPHKSQSSSELGSPFRRPTRSGQSKTGNIYDTMWMYLRESYKRKPLFEKGTLEEYLAKMRKDYWAFQGVPAKVMKKLIAENPGVVKMDESQNYSPTEQEMLDIATKYNGTLEGYAIPPESGRADARVMIDGFTLPVSDATAKSLQKQYKPDEFDKTVKGEWRFWWD